MSRNSNSGLLTFMFISILILSVTFIILDSNNITIISDRSLPDIPDVNRGDDGFEIETNKTEIDGDEGYKVISQEHISYLSWSDHSVSLDEDSNVNISINVYIVKNTDQFTLRLFKDTNTYIDLILDSNNAIHNEVSMATTVNGYNIGTYSNGNWYNFKICIEADNNLALFYKNNDLIGSQDIPNGLDEGNYYLEFGDGETGDFFYYNLPNILKY